MSERKTLTIKEVKEIERVGSNQIPKLSFKAKDGDKEYWYQTFRSSLFEVIKVGQTISADVEIKTREWDGQEYTDRRITQIYIDGQPVGGKKSQYRGKSPEELELSARAYALAYAKDMAVGGIIKTGEILGWADDFHKWLQGNGKQIPPEKEQGQQESEEKTPEPSDIKNLKFKNPGEFYTACLNQFKLAKSKADAAISEYDLSNPGQRKRAWETIVAIYGAKEEK